MVSVMVGAVVPRGWATRCVPPLSNWMRAGSMTLALSAAAAPAVAQAPAAARATAGLDARIARLERQLSSRTLFELLERIEALQRDVQTMRGDLEIQGHEITQIEQGQRRLSMEMDRLTTRVEAVPTVAASGTGNGAPSGPSSSLTDAGTAPPRVEPGGVSTNAGAQPGSPATAASSAGAAQNGIAGRPAGASTAAPARVAPPPSVVAVAPTGTLTSAVKPAPSPGAPSADPLKEQAAYSASFNLLKEGRYEKAAASFQKFLSAFPVGQYTDNAQYWLGEAFYVTRKFPRAMEEFQKLVAGFPASPKVPGAQLKIGFIHHELGQTDQAKSVLHELVTRYPKTTAARLAKDRLQRIDG